MRTLKTLALIVFCAFSLTFLTLVPSSLANPLETSVTQAHPHYFMGFFDRFKAKSKQMEGQAQEAKGKLTDDVGDQIMGKAKQAQGKAMEVTEDVKDAVKETADNVSDSLKSLGEKAQKALE